MARRRREDAGGPAAAREAPGPGPPRGGTLGARAAAARQGSARSARDIFKKNKKGA